MANPLNLVVARAVDIEITRLFYEALGCQFVSEKHAGGPEHYSCKNDSLVFEIYPGKLGEAPDWKSGGAVMVGFKVADFDDCLSRLRHEGVTFLTQPKDSPFGRYVMVADPDGRAVQISGDSKPAPAAGVS